MGGKLISTGISKWFDGAVNTIENFISKILETAIEKMLATPVPPNRDDLFMNLGEYCATHDCNGVWPELWTYYQDTVTPLAMVLLLLGWVLMVSVSSITSSVFQTSNVKKMNRRSVFAFIVIGLQLWWPAFASLSAFVQYLTQGLVPSNYIDGLGSALGAAGAGGVVAFLLSGVSLGTIFSVTAIYAGRWIFLHAAYVMGPILIALWALCAGPASSLSDTASKYLNKIPGILFVPIPVAALFMVVKPFLASGVMGMIYAVATLCAAGILPLKMNSVKSFAKSGANKAKSAQSFIQGNTDYGESDPDRNLVTLPGRTGSTNQTDDEEEEEEGEGSGDGSSSSESADENGSGGKDLNDPEEELPGDYEETAPDDAPAIAPASEDDIMSDEEVEDYYEDEEEDEDDDGDEGFLGQYRDEDGYFDTSRKDRGGGSLNRRLNRAAMAANIGVAGIKTGRKVKDKLDGDGTDSVGARDAQFWADKANHEVGEAGDEGPYESGAAEPAPDDAPELDGEVQKPSPKERAMGSIRGAASRAKGAVTPSSSEDRWGVPEERRENSDAVRPEDVPNAPEDAPELEEEAEAESEGFSLF